MRKLAAAIDAVAEGDEGFHSELEGLVEASRRPTLPGRTLASHSAARSSAGESCAATKGPGTAPPPAPGTSGKSPAATTCGQRQDRHPRAFAPHRQRDRFLCRSSRGPGGARACGPAARRAR